MNNKVDEILGIPSEHVEKTSNNIQLPMNTSLSKDENKKENLTDTEKYDIEQARKNLYTSIEVTKEASIKMLEVASQTDEPRAYEVLSTLIKTNIDANKELINLHKTKKQIEKETVNIKNLEETPKNNQKQTNITNTSIFVGSTNDLLRTIKSAMKKKQIIDDVIIDSSQPLLPEIKNNEVIDEQK